jgi:hypothetical protein
MLKTLDFLKLILTLSCSALWSLSKCMSVLFFGRWAEKLWFAQVPKIQKKRFFSFFFSVLVSQFYYKESLLNHFFSLFMFNSIVIVLIETTYPTEWLFAKNNLRQKPDNKNSIFFRIFCLITDKPYLFIDLDSAHQV